MATSQPTARPAITSRSRDVVSRSSSLSRARPSRSAAASSSSSEDDDKYAALYPYSPRRYLPPPRIQTPIDVGIYGGAYNSRRPPPDFRQPILAACRQGDVLMLFKLLDEARLVPVRPDQLPTTDEMVIEALDAPTIRILRILHVLLNRDPTYIWSNLAILKAIEKDKGYDPPLYLDVFLTLGLSPRMVWDRDVENHDALMWAVRSGSPEFVAMLLCAGADPNGAKYRKAVAHVAVATGIYYMARRSNFSIVYNLIKHGANPNGTGALQWAAGALAYENIRQGQSPWEANQIAQMLIEQGHADVNEVVAKHYDYLGLRHALGEATYHENIDLIGYLLHHGADPSIRPERDQRTAWEIAISVDGSPAVVYALVDAGISPATQWGILKS